MEITMQIFPVERDSAYCLINWHVELDGGHDEPSAEMGGKRIGWFLEFPGWSFFPVIEKNGELRVLSFS